MEKRATMDLELQVSPVDKDLQKRGLLTLSWSKL